jgi:hypothetical protein
MMMEDRLDADVAAGQELKRNPIKLLCGVVNNINIIGVEYLLKLYFSNHIKRLYSTPISAK